jgi:hypothetical protein
VWEGQTDGLAVWNVDVDPRDGISAKRDDGQYACGPSPTEAASGKLNLPAGANLI